MCFLMIANAHEKGVLVAAYDFAFEHVAVVFFFGLPFP